MHTRYSGWIWAAVLCLTCIAPPAPAAEILGEAFGAPARDIALGLARPRLSYNVAIYHRTRGPR